jgi:1,4-dihydroxy-2-naphthoate octaprenyltransferase
VWALLTWLSLPMVQALIRVVYRERGRPLNKALAATGQLDLLFSLLMAAGFVIARLAG